MHHQGWSATTMTEALGGTPANSTGRYSATVSDGILTSRVAIASPSKEADH